MGPKETWKNSSSYVFGGLPATKTTGLWVFLPKGVNKNITDLPEWSGLKKRKKYLKSEKFHDFSCNINTKEKYHFAKNSL